MDLKENLSQYFVSVICHSVRYCYFLKFIVLYFVRIITLIVSFRYFEPYIISPYRWIEVDLMTIYKGNLVYVAEI